MTYGATIGPVQFNLTASGFAAVPPIEGYHVREMEGRSLMGLVENEHVFLLLDYRPDPSPDEPAYVEFWQPVTPVEGPLLGMFLINAAFRPVSAYLECPSLASLALALQRAT